MKKPRCPLSVLHRTGIALARFLACSLLAGSILPTCAVAGPESATQYDPAPPVLSAKGSTDMVMANGLRFGLYKNRTRTVIDLSAQPGYRVFLLKNPNRVVVDLDHVFWEDVPPKGTGSGLVRSYSRQSVHDERTRLVLETTHSVRVANIFTIPARDQRAPRLVIDLERTDAAQSGNMLVADTIETPVTAPPPANSHTLKPPAKPSYTPETSTESTGRTLSAPLGAALVAPTIPRPGIKPAAWRVVLDAGHGGTDPGAIGVNKVHEKDVTLTVARKIRQELEKRGNYDVRLTRNGDQFIPLRERVNIARDYNAGFFVSLHADSHPDHDVRGASVYSLSEKASDKEAERLAGQENRVDAIGGVNLDAENADVANILIDLAMRDTMNQSKKAAGLLVDSFDRQNIRLVRNGHRSAGFVVLKAADVPSLLIEMGYLSNPKDAALLGDPEYIDRLVAAIADGIDSWFRGQQPTRQAANPISE